MAQGTVQLTIAFRWWVPHYLRALEMFADTFGLQVDVDKAAAIVCRWGVQIRPR